MIDHIAAAFDRKDYKTAAQLVKQLQQQSPDNPWVRLYAGRLQEVAGNNQAAEHIYRQILRETTNPKVAIQARDGLQRLGAIGQTAQQTGPTTNKSSTNNSSVTNTLLTDPNATGLGFLVLEPVSSEAKQAAAQAFARIMKLDAYTARLLLPSRGWKLYRIGSVGDLQGYSRALCEAGIPAFCTPLAAIQKIRVFRVQHFQAASPQISVVCQNETDQLGALSFDWSEVKHRVEGLLPIFEDVVDVGAFNRLKRKEQTQDFAQVLDLHLPKRNCILRLCDRTYQFHQGVIFDASEDGATPTSQTTTRIRWNKMMEFLGDRLSTVPTYSDFTIFAESALEHLDFVTGLPPYIDLLRKAPSKWDPAFQLYSGLAFGYNVSAKR